MAHPPDSNPPPNAHLAKLSKTQEKHLRELSNVIRLTLDPSHLAVETAALNDLIACARTSKLEDGELRVLIHHAGLTLESRTRVLEKILLHRRKHNRPPIAYDGEKWTCNLCPVSTPPQPADDRKPPLSVFQRVAKHLVSYHWGLRSWVCPVCRDSSYQSYDSFKRHNDLNHDGECEPNAISAPSPQREMVAASVESQRRPPRELPEYTPLDQHRRTAASQPHVSSTVDQTPPPVLPQISGDNNNSDRRQMGVNQHQQPRRLSSQHHQVQEHDQRISPLSNPVADRIPLSYHTGEPNNSGGAFALSTNRLYTYSASVHIPQSQHADLQPIMDDPTTIGHDASEVVSRYQQWVQSEQYPHDPSPVPQPYDQRFSFPSPARHVNADRLPILSNTHNHINFGPMYAARMNVPQHRSTEITPHLQPMLGVPTMMDHDPFEVAPSHQQLLQSEQHPRTPSQFTQAYDLRSPLPTPTDQVNADRMSISPNTNGHSSSNPMYASRMNIPHPRYTGVAQHPQPGVTGLSMYHHSSEMATDVQQWAQSGQHLGRFQFPQAQAHQLPSFPNPPTASTHHGLATSANFVDSVPLHLPHGVGHPWGNKPAGPQS